MDSIRIGTGNNIVVVFDEEHAFENLQISNAVAFAEFPAKVGRLAHTFPELDAGPNAVFFFHHENGDQDLNFSSNRLLEWDGATGASHFEEEPSFVQASVNPGPVNVQMFYEE